MSENIKYNPAEATAYLQVQLVRPSKYNASDGKVVAYTQTKPDRPRAGCIVVKVRLRIPVEGWSPFEPEAVIDVPADLVQHPVSVEVTEA